MLLDASQARLNDEITEGATSDLDFGQNWFDFDSWQADNATDVENLSSGNQSTSKNRDSMESSHYPFPDYNGRDFPARDLREEVTSETQTTIVPLNERHQSTISTHQQHNTYDTISISTNRSSSMIDDWSSSVNYDTWRGRKLLGKSSDKQRDADRGKSLPSTECMVESNKSVWIRHVSQSPGRRGPLDTIARAGIGALKAVGACWRCKILRKKVCSIVPVLNSCLSPNATVV